MNNYQYVPNPTGWVDPLGLASVDGDCVCGQYISLYHGSSPENIRMIKQNGIDVSKGKSTNDFGMGFYMTPSKAEALESAKMMSHDAQEFVEFRVPTAEFEQLNTINFSSASDEWRDFVGLNKSLDFPYLPPKSWLPEDVDMVTGPMFRDYNPISNTISFMNNRAFQTSIHTPKATEVFNKNMVK